MLIKKLPVLSIAALSAFLLTQNTYAEDTLTNALTGGKTSANLQYRYENVSTSSTTLKSATANTVRLRLGYMTDTFKGIGAMVEAESVTALGEKKYDSKASGQTGNGYETIADPTASEINQAYLNYSRIENTTAKWGRQRIKLDNDRFIGNVGWRQNEQTYDAFTLVNTSLPDTKLTIGYITNVNRVFSDDSATPISGAAGGNHKMESTILNANYKGLSFGELVGYAYLLKYDPTTGATGNTADTIGIRLKGSAPISDNKLLYTAEFATQKDGGNNPTKYSANYTLLEGGIDISSGVFKMGYEVLGADSGATVKVGGAATTKSFSTPLATLHAFNGWADLFLGTPSDGLKDTYVSAGTKVAGVKLAAIYHTFKTDKTNATTGTSNAGKEIDLVVVKPIDKNYKVGLKYAKYTAGSNNAAGKLDTKKAWLWGEFKF